MIGKILLILFFIINLHAKLSQDLIDNYNKKVQELPQIEEQYNKYDSLSRKQKLKLAKQILNLVPIQLIKKESSKDEWDEFIKLYAPLLNYRAYMIIDKYSINKDMLKFALNLSQLTIQSHPNNIAYRDTYLLGKIKSGDYDIALKSYAKLLTVSENEDIKKHFKLAQAFAIREAIKQNNIEELQKLYDMGADFNIKIPPTNWYAIVVAMSSTKYEKSARFLLEHGANVNALDSSGSSVLYKAVQNNFSEEFIRFILTLGAKKDYFKDTIHSSYGFNAYIFAKNTKINFFSKELINLLKPTSYSNPIFAYAYEKHKLYDDMYDFINNYNYVEDFQKESKQNLLGLVLHDYFYKYDRENKKILLKTIKLLLEKGIDLNIVPKSEKNSLKTTILLKLQKFPQEFTNFLFQNNYIDIDEQYYLSSRNTHWTPLFSAISSNNMRLFKYLIKEKADINYVDEKGLNLFYFSIYNDKLDMAKELIKAGYKVNLNPTSKRHPLAIAVLNNNIEAIKYLISLGYKPKSKILQRKNLLEFALRTPNQDLNRPQGYRKIIKFKTYKYLIDIFKADLLNTYDNEYHSFLLRQNDKDSFEAFKYLLEIGVDIHKNNKSYSPLQNIGIGKYFEQKAQILLDNNFDINHQDKDGDTVLHQLIIDYSKALKQLNKTNNMNYKDFYSKNDKNKNISNILKMAKMDKKSRYTSLYTSELKYLKEDIKFLIQKGSSKVIKNKAGFTPYSLALHRGIEDEEILKMLK